jgi:hypothetical protein
MACDLHAKKKFILFIINRLILLLLKSIAVSHYFILRFPSIAKVELTMYFYYVIHLINQKMKKILLFTLSILMATIVFGQSNDPIPSYNVFVQGNVSFIESAVNITNNVNFSADKRDMNVSNDGTGTIPFKGSGGSIIVVIYRLDHSISLGPYVIPPQQNLSVPIDNNPWGVTVVAVSVAYVSVWIDDGDNGQ